MIINPVIMSSGGGASNIVDGTFTTVSTSATEQSVSIPYTGNGYPIGMMLRIKDGVTGTAWSTSALAYRVAYFMVVKIGTGTTPTYNGSGDVNQGFAATAYNSTTTPSGAMTSISVGSNRNYYQYAQSTISNNAQMIAVFTSATTIKIRTCDASARYGLIPSCDYDYTIIYSE